LLQLFTQNEKEYGQLKSLANQKDSILQTKISFYQKNDSLQQQRVKNFENSYNSLLIMNQKYDEDLKACEKLAIDTKRMQTKNTIMVGAGALAVGLLLGLIIK
jgi:CRISPR/Cas system CMR subunit Cmr6 (Cas7 group RAMP superfamily)